MAIFQANVEQTIDRLFRLSAVIRSAGMSYRYAKAANFIKYEHQVNVTRKFREGVELLFKHKHPSPCDYMVKRLIESICSRQRELAYSQHYKRGPGGRKTVQETVQSGGVVSLPRPSQSAYMRQGGQGGSVSMVPESRRVAIWREKGEPHRLAPSAVYSATYVPTNVSSSSSRVRPVAPRAAPQNFGTIDAALRNLPPSPKTPRQQPELECPFCAIPFGRTKFDGPAWRYHTLHLFVPPLSSRLISGLT